MSQDSQNNNQEIDLGVLIKKINIVFSNFLFFIFKGILFIKRNILILITLIIVGFFAGYLLDRTSKIYTNQLIVSPNFGSTEYLYNKIELLSSKIKEKDYTFLKSMGVKEPELITEISIKPVIDIYNFVNNSSAKVSNAQNTQNFELIRLLSESGGDINKIIEDEVTSKNYPYHTIEIKMNGLTSNSKSIVPILNYLNNNEYFNQIQKTYIKNSDLKILKNQETIKQIDDLISVFSSTTNSNSKSDKLVYYNENTKLNEILATKNDLIENTAYEKILKINISKTIKDIGVILNNENHKGVSGKMKFIIPLILIFGFFFASVFRVFYNSQKRKLH